MHETRGEKVRDVSTEQTELGSRGEEQRELTALTASYGASHPETSRMILLDENRWNRRTSRTRKRTPSTRRKCRWRMNSECGITR